MPTPNGLNDLSRVDPVRNAARKVTTSRLTGLTHSPDSQCTPWDSHRTGPSRGKRTDLAVAIAPMTGAPAASAVLIPCASCASQAPVTSAGSTEQGVRRRPLPIDYDAAISQPYIVALMTELPGPPSRSSRRRPVCAACSSPRRYIRTS